jgi:hypothetical protein
MGITRSRPLLSIGCDDRIFRVKGADDVYQHYAMQQRGRHRNSGC